MLTVGRFNIGRSYSAHPSAVRLSATENQGAIKGPLKVDSNQILLNDNVSLVIRIRSSAENKRKR